MKKSKIFLVLTLLVSLFFISGFEVNAEDQLGKIIGNYTYGEEKLTNADASIYAIGTVEATASSYTYELLDDFKAEKVDYKKLTTQQMEEHVNKLISIIEEKNIQPLSQVKTDINGQFTFDSFKAGLYLIKVNDLTVNDKIYKSLPSLVFLPDIADDGSYDYNASVHMKTEMKKIDDSGNDDVNNNGGNNNQGSGSNVNTPNTYDAIVMYVALFIVSIVLLAVLICYIYIYNKKRENKDNEKSK